MTLILKQIDMLTDYISDLSDLLYQCVETGASIGFVPPFSHKQAETYWHSLQSEIKTGDRYLCVALLEGQVVGTGQLFFCPKVNGHHRANLEKLLTHPGYRKRGIASALLQQLEQEVRARKRFLIELDTRSGDDAERLYRKSGYQEVGQIPAYALNGDGVYDPTTIFYKDLRQ